MAFVNVVRGMGATRRHGLPMRVRQSPFARGFQERARRSRGMGQTTGWITLPSGARIQEQGPYTDSAVNYPEAPTCNVVDLSQNMCAFDNGLIAGCNGIQDCDPLTGAVHGQYALPGGPIQGQPSTLKTVAPGFQFPVYGYSPNLSLKNPTGPSTPVVFQSQTQIDANIAKALGPALYKQYQAASGVQPSGGAPSGGGSPPRAASPSGGTATPPVAGFDFSFLANPISLFGFHVPMWALIAAGGASLYAFSGGHRR
jgi:hypothetical protein